MQPGTRTHGKGHGRPGPGPAPQEPALVYGVHPVLEKLRAAPGDVVELLLAPGSRGPALRRVEQAARQAGCRVSAADARALDALTQGASHQGVAARVAPFAYSAFDALLAEPPPEAADCVLFLDGVLDPGNLGGILRTSEAMGVTRIVLPRDRAAGVTGTVIKASAGAAHHVTLYRIPNLLRGLMALRDRGYWLVGLDAGAETQVCDPVYPDKVAAVLGGEERGIRPLIRRRCDTLVSVPMQGRVGSLNVGAAWSIFVYEWTRQRISTEPRSPR